MANEKYIKSTVEGIENQITGEMNAIIIHLKVLRALKGSMELKKFDGKVINKNLREAFQNIAGCFGRSVGVSCSERREYSIFIGEPTHWYKYSGGSNAPIYADYYRRQIFFETSDKRFNYEEFIKSVVATIDELVQTHKEYKIHLQNVETNLSQHIQLAEKMNKLREKAGPMFRSQVKVSVY